ncbi:hypothetical protein B1759_16035 [Rubrivirga sp. SAORIC476]|uniref:DUF4440 domain-containing protein n=1 Tax=Rubrivirga sp. SAORIC476 TaxID=1961794 RepID=UPI000BCEC360|nr:nuclear transport factor 2 family protein [Rubrivirga sp. SAORIC476]PAP78943.1 hypothetical protein B1759_16035 [Rubrivirga sp. SAORIC476]
MKRHALYFALALVLGAVIPTAQAQEHQHADTTRAAPMDHGHMDGMDGMDHGAMDMDAMMPRMMAMHERMMADPEMHQRMMAMPEMRAMMQEMMGGEMDMAAMRERMVAMSPDERRAHMRQMHAQMMERMEAMDPEQRRAMHERMRAMHERMMADPEMRERMEGMHGDGPMDHGQMDHGDGVAMQRRNAGAHNGDERPATPAVGQAEFDASATADRFHAALAAGDRPAVEVLLLPDAVVLEGGRHESRTEYLSHHFARDAAFLADAAVEPLFRRTTVAGDAAWVASTQRIGDAEMAELLVMKRTPEGWRVAAVHWSSGR